MSIQSYAQVDRYYRSFNTAVYPSSDPLKLWMSVEKSETSEKPLRVDLVDKNNHVLHTTWIPKKGKTFRQLFDLSQMKDGFYSLRISDGQEVIEKSFQLKTPGIEERLPQRYLSFRD